MLPRSRARMCKRTRVAHDRVTRACSTCSGFGKSTATSRRPTASRPAPRPRRRRFVAAFCRRPPSASDRPVLTLSFVMQELFDDLRAKINSNASLAFADHEVESWWDATRGSGSGPRIAAGAALPVTADCNHIIFWTRQGAIISVRASGTEPKIKVRCRVSFGVWERIALCLRH